MVEKIDWLRIEERGKEFKVPHYTSTVVVHEGNLPHIKATCLK